jgi:hypothetical protein
MIINYIIILIIITLLIYYFLTTKKQKQLEAFQEYTISNSDDTVKGSKTTECLNPKTASLEMGCIWNRLNSGTHGSDLTPYNNQSVFKMIYSTSSKTNVNDKNKNQVWITGLMGDEPYKFISAQDWIPNEYKKKTNKAKFEKLYVYFSVGKDVVIFFNNSKTDVPTERSIQARNERDNWHYSYEEKNITNDKYNYSEFTSYRNGNIGGSVHHMDFTENEMGFEYSNTGDARGFWGIPNQVYSFMLVSTRAMLDAYDATCITNDTLIETLISTTTSSRSTKCMRYEPEFLDDKGLTPYPNTIPYIDFRIAHHLVAFKDAYPEARNLLIELGESVSTNVVGLRSINPNGSGSKDSSGALDSTSTFNSVELGSRNGYRNQYGVEVGRKVDKINNFNVHSINIPAGVRVWLYPQENCMGTPIVYDNCATIKGYDTYECIYDKQQSGFNVNSNDIKSKYGKGYIYDIHNVFNDGVKSFVSQPIWATDTNVTTAFNHSRSKVLSREAAAAKIIQDAADEVARLQAVAAAAADEAERLRLEELAKEVIRLAEIAALKAKEAEEIRMANLVEEAKKPSDLGWEYKGCYADNINSIRDLPDRAYNPDTNDKFTQKECRIRAMEFGKKYFGLQSGGECWMGDDYDYGSIDKSTPLLNTCNMSCDRVMDSGNNNDDLLISNGITGCGAVDANSIYQINTIAPGSECGVECEAAKQLIYAQSQLKQ